MSQPYRFRYGCDMARAPKYRDVVREIALGSYGFVTTRAAREAGVPAIELPKLAARGGLVHVAYGLYRVTDVPPTVLDQYAEAILRVGEGAHLYAESVLALFGLADVNPRKVRVGVSRRARPALPPYIELVRIKGDARTTRYEGLAAQPVADALIASLGRVETKRLREATRKARAEGLLTVLERRRVMHALGS